MVASEASVRKPLVSFIALLCPNRHRHSGLLGCDRVIKLLHRAGRDSFTGAGGPVASLDGALKATLGLRMTQEDEFEGADLSIHRIGATPEREVNW